MSDAGWFRIGHTTYERERTGCTAIIFDSQVAAAVDVRGGAPGTRETTLLDPGNVGLLDAIVLSGGSAFGLQAADGVMRYLAENGRGFQTRAGVVPLVSSAIIYDLAVGTPLHPSENDGYNAASNAAHGHHESGRIGAGAGATVAKMDMQPLPGGIGIASASQGKCVVTAVVVLNAVGDIRHPETGAWLARCEERSGRDRAVDGMVRAQPLENTTIGAVMVDAELDRRSLQRVCISAQSALARCTVPAHTVLDGDTFYAVASRTGSPDTATILAVSALTEIAVERAIVSIFA